MSELEFNKLIKSIKNWFKLAILAGVIVSGASSFVLSKVLFANDVINTVYQTKEKVAVLEENNKILIRYVQQLQVNMIELSKMHEKPMIEIPDVLKK